MAKNNPKVESPKDFTKETETLLKLLKKDNQSLKGLTEAFKIKQDKVLELAGRLRQAGHNVSVFEAEGEKQLSLARVEKRDWPETPVFVVDKGKWLKNAPRVGFFSGLDFKDAGFRAGLLLNAFEVFAFEACRYICLVGRLINKKWFRDQIKKAPANLRKNYQRDLIEESAKELAYTIPKIKKPGNKNEFVRIYIVTSPAYDNDIGEEVARKLQEFRPEDIRVYNSAIDQVDVKEVDKKIGLIAQEIKRLPSEYYSAAVDREVKDREGEGDDDYPNLWTVGATSASVHEPRRGRKPPVISLPSLKRLIKVRIGENQQGIRIVEFSRESDDYFVRTYSMKDLTRRERQFITGIKDGAQEIHKKIVEIIKKEKKRPEGVIADRLKMENEREKVWAALQFLVEDKSSPRTTWPGLHYDEHSQCYDFHLDWIQEKLRYPSLLSNNLIEERFAFFSCLHSGYNTTDYEYLVRAFPEWLLRNKVRFVCCLGDLIAGLSHNFLEEGEVMGGMNYTEQETFAAELLGTGFMKVFERGLESLPSVGKLAPAEIIDLFLPILLYIAGNHDDWQKRLGISPLRNFRKDLLNLLAERIETALRKHGHTISFSEIMAALNKKLVRLSIDGADYNPNFILPSGLSVELHHPHMGRAKTKSLRAQELLETSDAQIVGQGNFHTAIVTEKWEPDLGQRVNVEAGTFAIFTTFERHKGNKKPCFGPVYLRTQSADRRIIMSESSFDQKQILQQPRPKWTDWQKLKDELGVYRAP